MTRKFSGEELVLATQNKGKLAEIEPMFKNVGVKLLSAADFGLDSPEETEDTFVGNALIKAKYVAEKTGKPALADDSGFCVDVLDGAPGVYTADWAETENGRDWNLAMNKVNNAIGDDPNRKAHFTCCLVLAWPDGHYETVEGIVNGDVVWPPRGEMGFGQDPIFVPEGESRTFAEMTKEEKAQFSHRADAFHKMMDKCFNN